MSKTNPTAKERLGFLERQKESTLVKLQKLDERIADMAAKAEREVSDEQIRNTVAGSIQGHLDRLGFGNVQLTVDNVGPFGGHSAQVTLTVEGRRVVINTYCDDTTNQPIPPAPFRHDDSHNRFSMLDQIDPYS